MRERDLSATGDIHAVVVSFKVHAGAEAAFLERVRKQASDSLELESGCLVFDVCVDPADERQITLYELYTDREAFALHLASDHFKAFDAEVGGWVAEKEVAQLRRLAR